MTKSDANGPKYSAWMQSCLNYAYIFVRGFVLRYSIYPMVAGLICLFAVYAFEIESRTVRDLLLALLLVSLISLIGHLVWQIRQQGRSAKRLIKEQPMTQLSDQEDKK